LPRSRSPRYQAANSASRNARCPLVNIANSRSVPPASKTFLKVNRYGTSLRPPRGFGIAASTFFGTGTGTVEPARATAQKRPMRSSRPALSLSRGRDEAGRPTSLRPTDCTPRKNAKIRVDWKWLGGPFQIAESEAKRPLIPTKAATQSERRRPPC
jgi:hypothetical protein